MRFAFRTILVAFLLTMLSGQVSALSPDETDPGKVAEAVELRDTGSRMTATVQVTVRDAAGNGRERVFLQWMLDFEDLDKTLMIFQSPADMKNTGFLSIDYDDGEKEDDQWLYLPSLHKTTRIGAAAASDSFLGTDLTFADMTTLDTSDYEYKMVDQAVSVDGELCWLIESRPKTDKERERTGYTKTLGWISKEKLMPIRLKAWLINGRKLKYSQMSNIDKISGIWTAQAIDVRVVQSGKLQSTTSLRLHNVRYNQERVTDDLFTARRLEQGL